MSESALLDVEQTAEEKDAPLPNKYLYPEFAGLAGERYLLSLAEQFAPLALWRTWQAFVSFQAPGKSCYVGVSRVVERIGPQARKVYLDLQALEQRGWLVQERVWQQFVQNDGQMVANVVTIRDFTGFYQTAHDYHCWLHSPEYLAPLRENLPLIQADPALVKRLIRFENYRRLLVCAKPGRKSSRETEDFYAHQLSLLETRSAASETTVTKVNQYSNTPANTDSLYRREETGISHVLVPSILSMPERGGLAIRNTNEQQVAKPPLPSKPNTPPPPKETMGAAAAAAKTVETSLGYTEEELRRDLKLRGAAVVGIPAAQYRQLQGEAAQESVKEPAALRPVREVPVSVVQEIATYARQYDDAHLVASDITRVRKFYATAEQALEQFTEQVFWGLYDEARNAAAKYARKRQNSRGRVNRVPYLFTCLENACGFSLEELVYLRTEDPLYTDYSLWDVLATLRATYREQCQTHVTTLDYRAWLQGILDTLEKVKEPKQRNHPTSR